MDSVNTTLPPHAVYTDFVNVNICMELQKLGLVINCPYRWRIQNNLATLHTSVFDLDDYYQAGQKMIDQFTPCYYIPAFRLSEIAVLMEDFEMAKQDGYYTIKITYRQDIEPVRHQRLADALGLMLIDYIRSAGKQVQLYSK